MFNGLFPVDMKRDIQIFLIFFKLHFCGTLLGNGIIKLNLGIF